MAASTKRVSNNTATPTRSKDSQQLGIEGQLSLPTRPALSYGAIERLARIFAEIARKSSAPKDKDNAFTAQNGGQIDGKG